MTNLPEKLLHLANLENSTIQVGYRDEYDDLGLDNISYYDDHYKTISLCLKQILLSLEFEDIENQQQEQRLKEWIERYPLSLGVLNWEDYDSDDEEYQAGQRFPFLLREIIRKDKFRLLPFLIEAGMNYFEADLRGGLLHKISCFDQAHVLFPHDFVYPGMTVLDAIVSFNYDDAVALDVLSTLKEVGILQRNDIQEQNLLSKTFYSGMHERFDFLVEMDPDALFEEVNEADIRAFDIPYSEGTYENFYESWTPALMLLLATYNTRDFKTALQATLKIFPSDLGLLLLQAKDNDSYPSWNGRAVLLSYVNEWFDIDHSWEVIESSFRDMTNRQTLFSLDQEKGIYPFMKVAESLAACCEDGDIKLTLLYYLLREDLSWSDAL